MRRFIAVLSAAVVLVGAGPAAQAKPNFAGEWKVVTDAAGGRGPGQPGIDLTVTQSADESTVDYRAGAQSPGPVKLTYKLDGSMSRNSIAVSGGGAPTEQVSKARWAANKLVVTTTTGAGEEKRTFSMEADTLVVETSGARPGGPNVTRVSYKRYERGHGG